MDPRRRRALLDFAAALDCRGMPDTAARAFRLASGAPPAPAPPDPDELARIRADERLREAFEGALGDAGATREGA